MILYKSNQYICRLINGINFVLYIVENAIEHLIVKYHKKAKEDVLH